MKNIDKQKNKGFTLLFAILISVLVLAIGASVISVALKQSILSSTGRESQFAFYAANSGLECALFWDLNPGVVGGNSLVRVFPYRGVDSFQSAIPDYTDVNCGDTNIEDGVETGTDITWTDAWASSTTEVEFKMAVRNSIDNGSAPDIDDFEYCALVKVEKASSTINGSSTITTTITSQGLNTCDPDNDPRAVQRGLLMEYNQRNN